MDINSKVVNIINAKRSEIAEHIVEKQYKNRPEVWEKYGEKGKELSIRDAEYHLPFLTEAIITRDETIFTDYIEWTRKLFHNINLPEEALSNFFYFAKEVLEDYLDGEMKKVADEYIDKGIAALDVPLSEERSYLNRENPYASLAQVYNEALLRGDRHTASQIIMDALDSGVDIRNIYIHVFQPSQYEVGRLWLANKISVAKEHFASAATQQIMSQLYPHIFNTNRLGKTVVAATVGGELHEIGIRMVADFFEMEGWDTYYLGANTPAPSIIQTIKEYNADVVALSAAMPYHRSVLKEVVQEIKSQAGTSLKIMVGGNAVKNNPDDWKWFEADGYASDAQKAVARAFEIAG